jgi:uncharacterized membrane protein
MTSLRTPLAARWRLPARLPPPSNAQLVLGALILLYIATFGVLTWRQQSRFGTFGFDMGIYDQGIWLVSRFKEPFVTVRGLNYFGHHFNPITVLFVPFYWLGAGPHLLYLAQTIWMALGAVPLWLLARDRLNHEWSATALGAAFLLYPSLQWINWWHFHPDALMITPLLFAYWLGITHKWRWYPVAVGTALLCKEDAALAVLMLGLVMAATVDRRKGLMTAAAGLVWFVVVTRVVIPFANGGEGPFYETFFPGLGDSVGEIFYNALRHPSRIYEPALASDRLSYYGRMLGPLAFVPVVGIPALLICAPQTVINVVSGHAYTYEFKYHYSSVLVAAIFIAAVEGCRRLSARRLPMQTFLVGGILAASIVTNVAWSPSPIGREFDRGTWAKASPRHAAIREALSVVPDDAGVSATYYLVPQLTHRVHIYEWPNPWVAAHWGVRDENPPPPSVVDYLVVDTDLLGNSSDLFRRLTSPIGDFEPVYERSRIIVARRRT